MAKKNISKKDILYEYAFITVAMLIISASIYFFLIPSKVVIGSISGLAMVLEELTGFSISMLTMGAECGASGDRISFSRKGIRCKDGIYFYVTSCISQDF